MPFEGVPTGNIKINENHQRDIANFSNRHINDKTRTKRMKKDSKMYMTSETIIYGRRLSIALF